MVSFNEAQKKIAALLARGPKTAEELNRELQIPFDQLSKELKELLKLKLITIQGYPPKYELIKEISGEIKRRKEIAVGDPFELRLKIIIDVQALTPEVAEKSLQEVEKALRKDADFTIYEIFKAKPLQQEEHYTSYLEGNLSVKDFKSLVKLMYFFGPTTVEVLKPPKWELKVEDLQDGLMDMAEMIQAYNYHILRMMNKKELEDFQRKLFQ